MRRLMTAAEFLQACSQGRIGTREAMHAIGADSSSDLPNATVDCRSRLPCGRRRRDEEVEREAVGTVPVPAEAPGLPI